MAGLSLEVRRPRPVKARLRQRGDHDPTSRSISHRAGATRCPFVDTGDGFGRSVEGQRVPQATPRIVPDRSKLNDYRQLVFGTDPYRKIAFVCECDNEACARTVVLNRFEFEDLRRAGKPVLFHAHLVRPSVANVRSDGAVKEERPAG